MFVSLCVQVASIIDRKARKSNTGIPMNSLDVRIYDPRALDPASATRASLHAKVLIVDRRSALVTSANFTDAAQKRNVETGVLITYRPFVIRLADTFAGLQKHLFVELH